MPLSSGQLLNNRYRILRLLGQGGMGAVYLAEDDNLPGKQVAIKENLDLSQAAQDQFKREATILARLKHPNLPQVADHFVLPTGAQYLVMEHVEGEDLEQILARRGPLPEAEVLGWMGQVLDAVEYMHTWVDPATGQVTPVVHRDIKPANIKRTPRGRIMLVDFGIAKYQQAGGTLTGARAASPGFSPLEQYTGGTDVRSDIYSLGATLYCLLTGRIPPEAPDLAAGSASLLPPRALAPMVSGNTETTILQAMRLPVSQRYQRVADLQLALTPGAWQACPACGAANRMGARFCHNCGGLLTAAATASNPTLVTPRRLGWGRPDVRIALLGTAVVVLVASAALAARLVHLPTSVIPSPTPALAARVTVIVTETVPFPTSTSSSTITPTPTHTSSPTFTATVPSSTSTSLPTIAPSSTHTNSPTPIDFPALTASPSQRLANMATPAPTKALPVVDIANPAVPAIIEAPIGSTLKDWQRSGHSDVRAEAFRHWDQSDPQAVPAACAKCHSSGGYRDYLGADGSAAGKVDKAAAINTVVDCVACHNSVTSAKEWVIFPSGIGLTGLGAESVCIECHQGRESKVSLDRQVYETFGLTDQDLDIVVKPMVNTVDGKATTTTFGFRNIHYYAAAATQYGTLASGGYEYDGHSYDGKFEHAGPPYNTCISCHDPHSLKRTVDKCWICHAGVRTAEDLVKIRFSNLDYDGDGDVKEGVAFELAGLQEKLLVAIKAYAKEVARADICYDTNTYPYFLADANANGKLDQGEKSYSAWTPRLLRAAYNYQVSMKDPGAYAHNPRYIVQLLYDSIEDLGKAVEVDMASLIRPDLKR